MRRGNYYKLNSIFRKLNRIYFEGHLKCRLSWGRVSSALVRRSRRLGSFNPRNNAIMLSPVLDQAKIPYYVVASVVHHEMCHALIPPKRIGRRNYSHHKGFRKKEQEYQYFFEAKAWIKKNQKLLFNPPEKRKAKAFGKDRQLFLFP
jgi:predicted SprT family Zn-dependent metalloprotease